MKQRGIDLGPSLAGFNALSSDGGSLDDIDWKRRPWNASSKIYIATLFAAARARPRPNVLSNAVDPGWVRTGARNGRPYDS